MQASIQPIFTWSQDRIFAGGIQTIVLLVEWKGISPTAPSRNHSRRVAAREIELRIWLEPHMNLVRCYGCVTEAGEGRSLLFRLGKIHSGQRKFIALEFAAIPMPAGKYEALWLQWQYKQPSVERIRELPVNKLGLEYTHHTSALGNSSSFHVEKHLELLKSREALEEAALLRAKGQADPSSEKLCRQADKLLLLATRSGDLQLLKEADNLYKQIEIEHRLASGGTEKTELKAGRL